MENYSIFKHLLSENHYVSLTKALNSAKTTTETKKTLTRRTKNNIAYARYKVGSTYYQAEIQTAEVLADGRIAVTFIIDHTVFKSESVQWFAIS